MKPQQSNYAYGSISSSATRGAESRYTFLGLINLFIVKLLSAIPLSIRIFLRKRIGSMTFSLVGLLFAALWIRFILDGTYQMHELTPPETFWYEYFNKGNGIRYYFALAVWYVGVFFIQFGGVIVNFIPPSIADGVDSISEVFSNFPFFLSSGVIILGFWRYWQIRRMHAKRQIFDPMSRGESVVFEPLLILIQPRNRNLTLMFIEVTLLLFLAIIFYIWSFNNPEWLNYAVLTVLGAIGLAIEEWISQHQLEKELEFRFANELKAVDLQNAYQQYKREILDTSATVSFVAFTTLSVPSSRLSRAYSKTYDFQLWRKYLPVSRNKKWIFGAGAFLFILTLTSIFAFTSNDEIEEVGIIKTLNLTVRQKPSLSAKSIGTIPQGVVVKIYDCYSSDSDNRYWCKISYNDKVGYVTQMGSSGNYYMWTLPISLYEFSFNNLPYEDKVITKEGGHLNLRSSPALNAPIIQKIANDETVTVIDMASAPEFMTVGDELIFGSWCLIEYQGQQGYCFSWYLNEVRIPNLRPAIEGPLE
ncbi:SH3 domain-containing protein [Lewinella sp. LCG006]|uniref:SH3 domain-containing protein n=1 Tax=Lewinella sp. LCG006 TaxID=3231911 RepID=UPI00345FCCBE